MIVWDDVGYGVMDVFGGLIEMLMMWWIVDIGLCYLNFYIMVLCLLMCLSLFNGCNVMLNNMVCIIEVLVGFFGFLVWILFENGMIVEVFNECGWNMYVVGKWYLMLGEEIDLLLWKGCWLFGCGFECFYGFMGGEIN